MEQRPDTLSLIQLIKSILEYYGTTKKIENKNVLQEFNNEIEEAQNLIENFDKEPHFIDELNSSGLFVQIPDDMHEEIKKTFLSQLRSYQTNNNKEVL
tara:strand:- start:1364 stop:1657 length:294 start_codon:yes stop_codon:yes gene_type:complete